jgi:hypothetical protein
VEYTLIVLEFALILAVNIVQHTYWNLAGHASKQTVLDHIVSVVHSPRVLGCVRL